MGNHDVLNGFETSRLISSLRCWRQIVGYPSSVAKTRNPNYIVVQWQSISRILLMILWIILDQPDVQQVIGGIVRQIKHPSQVVNHAFLQLINA